MSAGNLAVFRGITTAVAMLAFVAVVLWAWSGRRKQSFDEAAKMALDDQEEPRP
jgi:cytochrome c oxidase cbb3-type subunit 4